MIPEHRNNQTGIVQPAIIRDEWTTSNSPSGELDMNEPHLTRLVVSWIDQSTDFLLSRINKKLKYSLPLSCILVAKQRNSKTIIIIYTESSGKLALHEYFINESLIQSHLKNIYDYKMNPRKTSRVPSLLYSTK